MFSKKPLKTTATPTPGAAERMGLRVRAAIALPLTNPYVGMAGAGLMLAVGLAGMVMMGNPDAGAPSVRLSLAHAAATPGGHGETVPEGGDFLASEEGLPPFMEVIGSDTAPSSPGEVVITTPGAPRTTAVTGLARAPIAGLTEPGPGGLLPVIATDGRTPFSAYARPFRTNGKPRVAVIIGGLGINPVTTRQAIETLPADITLSFAPSADGLQGWIDLARQFGHEVMLDMPMEPLTYPQEDPGPYTLMANGRADDNTRKLESVLGRATGYFGVINYLGSKFVAGGPGIETFNQVMRKRGLAFIDDGAAAARGGGLQRASASLILDDPPSGEVVARQLAQIEGVAMQRGQALGSGFGYAVTIRQVQTWAAGLPARGLQLAPASALTARR